MSMICLALAVLFSSLTLIYSIGSIRYDIILWGLLTILVVISSFYPELNENKTMLNNMIEFLQIKEVDVIVGPIQNNSSIEAVLPKNSLIYYDNNARFAIVDSTGDIHHFEINIPT